MTNTWYSIMVLVGNYDKDVTYCRDLELEDLGKIVEGYVHDLI